MSDEAWLIEDVWTPGPTLYVHKDFTLKAWTEEMARNRERRWRGLGPRDRVQLCTNNAGDAMRFDTFGAAILWLSFQPKWLNSGQYQAREHEWVKP